jgi:hypothetical protein
VTTSKFKKLQIIQNKIIRSIFGEDKYTSNTSIHRALGVRSLSEEIERESAKLYHRFRQYDNPFIAALGNCDIHMYYFYT